MSHVVEVDISIQDLDALEEAAKMLGLELVRGQNTYRWFGRSVGDYALPAGYKVSDLGKCEHALRIPGDNKAYEIGVSKRRDGKPGYSLVWDFFAGGYGMEKKVGENCQKLEQAYTVALACRHYRRKGYSVRTETKHDRILVKARK